MPDLRPALRMENYRSIDDWAATTSETQIGGAQSDSRKSGEFSFYFRPGEAHLQTENCAVNDLPKRLFKPSLSKPITDEMFNDCHLREMAKRIEQTNNGENVRIILIGHGDKEPIVSGRYISNYELSKARAENVVYEVLQRVSEKQKWHNIEWVILPASNEKVDEIAVRLIKQNPDELQGKFTQEQIAKGIDKDQLAKQLGINVFASVYDTLGPKRSAVENRVVLASLQPITNHVASLTVDQITTSSDARPLALIDYMYFSIYTITTTGYGDIIPTTAYAKFVTSIANLCEVLFLVVFFNALISLRPKQNGSNVHQSAPPIPVPADEESIVDQERNRRAVLQGAFGRE